MSTQETNNLQSPEQEKISSASKDKSSATAETQPDYGELIDLSQYEKGRFFSEFPLSPETLFALNEKVFSIATRIQTVVLERGLAGESLLSPLTQGGSRYLPMCLTIIENVPPGGRKISAMVFSENPEVIKYFTRDLAELGRFKDLRILPIFNGDSKEGQISAIRDGVDVVVGSAERISELISQEGCDLSMLQIVGFCDICEFVKDGAANFSSDLFGKLSAARQILGFHSVRISQDIHDGLKQIFPDVPCFNFQADQSHKVRMLCVTESDKNQLVLRLIVQSSESFAVLCESDERCLEIYALLSEHGISAEFLPTVHTRRQKDRIARSMRTRRRQCLILTDPNIDRNLVSTIVSVCPPEKVQALSGFPGKLIWFLTPKEQRRVESEFSSLSVKMIPEPEEIHSTARRTENFLNGLNRTLAENDVRAYLPLLEHIRNHPQADLLLAAALKNSSMWLRMSDYDTAEDIIKLEAKEERSYNKNKSRQRRRSRHSRRR